MIVLLHISHSRMFHFRDINIFRNMRYAVPMQNLQNDIAYPGYLLPVSFKSILP
jgi:hypothetical protein